MGLLRDWRCQSKKKNQSKTTIIRIYIEEYTNVDILKSLLFWGMQLKIISYVYLWLFFYMWALTAFDPFFFEAPSLPALTPSICLRLSALMNAPGRLERRHDGLKEVILNSKQMCLILGIHITLLCVCCDLTRCFLTMHRCLSTQIHPHPDISLTHTG